MNKSERKALNVYTYEDLSKLTGVSVEILRVWHYRGRLPAADYRIGQSPAWRAETVKPWIATYQDTKR